MKVWKWSFCLENGRWSLHPKFRHQGSSSRGSGGREVQAVHLEGLAGKQGALKSFWMGRWYAHRCHIGRWHHQERKRWTGGKRDCKEGDQFGSNFCKPGQQRWECRLRDRFERCWCAVDRAWDASPSPHAHSLLDGGCREWVLEFGWPGGCWCCSLTEETLEVEWVKGKKQEFSFGHSHRTKERMSCFKWK